MWNSWDQFRKALRDFFLWSRINEAHTEGERKDIRCRFWGQWITRAASGETLFMVQLCFVATSWKPLVEMFFVAKLIRNRPEDDAPNRFFLLSLPLNLEFLLFFSFCAFKTILVEFLSARDVLVVVKKRDFSCQVVSFVGDDERQTVDVDGANCAFSCLSFRKLP